MRRISASILVISAKIVTGRNGGQDFLRIGIDANWLELSAIFVVFLKFAKVSRWWISKFRESASLVCQESFAEDLFISISNLNGDSGAMRSIYSGLSFSILETFVLLPLHHVLEIFFALSTFRKELMALFRNSNNISYISNLISCTHFGKSWFINFFLLSPVSFCRKQIENYLI